MKPSTRAIWNRRNINQSTASVQRIACTVIGRTDLGQLKIIAHRPGRSDAVVYVAAKNVEIRL